MTIDPRLAERRKTVAEDNAVRNLRRLLRLLGALVVVGAVVWFVFSPWMSVSQVRVAGVSVSGANAILGDHRVVAGTPMVMLRPGAVEAALIADPWVRDARVHLDWPDEVVVQVIEREPVAFFRTVDGWTWRDVYGVALPGPDSPDPEMAWVELPALENVDAPGSSMLVGAAEFVTNLPAELHPGTRIRVEAGEIWAVVAGWQVRLGRPIEMKEKALSLVALLDEMLPEDSVLVLVAPSHPAVSPPVTEIDTANESGSGDGEDVKGQVEP